MTPLLLTAHPWETSYRHEDGDLVALFYVPALSCAVRYDRMTGYFSASALFGEPFMITHESIV